MKSSQKAMLALEDGAVFEGWSFVCWGEKSVAHDIPCITTLSGAEAVANTIESLKRGISVKTVTAYPTVA
jgi:hypothetical protein